MSSGMSFMVALSKLTAFWRLGPCNLTVHGLMRLCRGEYLIDFSGLRRGMAPFHIISFRFTCAPVAVDHGILASSP